MSRKVTKDGRTILTGSDYTQFRIDLYASQDWRCSKCSAITNLRAPLDSTWSFHIHHKNGRGMGGGKRDDTLEAVIGLCGACHRKEHNQ